MGLSDEIREFKIFIDGVWMDAAAGRKLNVVNPATEEIVARIQLCDAQDVDRAAHAADKAFAEWKAKDPKARAALMHKAAVKVREQTEALSRLLTAEMGKPLGDARKEIADSAATLDFFADEGVRVAGEVVPLGTHAATSLMVYEPVGVCAAIAPWNYPVSLLAWKIGPALAAGCTIVCKPASETPTAALE